MKSKSTGMSWPWQIVIAAWIFASLASSIQAQDMIETFRGDEINDRRYQYPKQYFFNILSFDFDLAREKDWDLSRSGYRGTAGSLNSRDIYLIQEMKFRPQLKDPIGFRFHFLQAEDHDSRYVRTTFEPEFKINENWTLQVPMQIMPDKENLDLGFGLNYHDESTYYLRLSYLSSDFLFNSETEDDRKFIRNPGTLNFQGSWMPSSGVWMKWSLNRVLPLEWELNDESYTFDFRRLSYSHLTQIELGVESDLFLLLQGEQTGKSRNYFPGLELFDDRLNRSAAKIRAEYREQIDTDEIRAGVQYFALRESDVRLNDPFESEYIRRRESSVFFGYRHAFDSKLSLFTTLYLSYLNNRTTVPGDPDESSHDEHPISKMSFAFQYRFTDRAVLIIDPTIQFFGSTPYGGTNVQLMVTF